MKFDFSSFNTDKFKTAAAVGGGLGILGIGLDMWKADNAYNASVREWKQQSDSIVRANQRQALMISESNKRTADIYKYQTGRFQTNLGFIEDEYARAGEDIQRELGTAFAQSAYSRQAQLATLSQAVGFNRAAFEGTSRSRQRADVLGTIGTFGRNAAMEAERLAGVVSQSGRNRQALGRQATQSTFNAFGDLGILPELQRYVGQEIPMRPEAPNMGLQIATGFMNTAQQALTMGLSMQ